MNKHSTKIRINSSILIILKKLNTKHLMNPHEYYADHHLKAFRKKRNGFKNFRNSD